MITIRTWFVCTLFQLLFFGAFSINVQSHVAIVKCTCNFLQHDSIMLWVFLGILIACFIARDIKIWREELALTNSMPLSHPPVGVSPVLAGALLRKRYSDVLFAAQVVQLAVKGYIDIEYQERSLKERPWWRDFPRIYVLKKKAGEAHLLPEEQNFFAMLFYGGCDRVVLDGKNTYRQCTRGAQLDLYACVVEWFDTYLVWRTTGIVRSVQFRRGYANAEVKNIVQQLHGFKLFLMTFKVGPTLSADMKTMRTLELYESYLPYAIAFGVEKEWASQFTEVFVAHAQNGEHYASTWYSGPCTPLYAGTVGSTMASIVIPTAMTHVSFAEGGPCPSRFGSGRGW